VDKSLNTSFSFKKGFKSLDLYGIERGEIRCPFLHFAFLINFVYGNSEEYIFYSYPTFPIVLSNMRSTKFVVGTSLRHCIFLFIRRKQICDFPNWKIEMKPFLFSLSRPFV
jgi:hypothetical protein